jgi:hypothetical protein
MHKSRYVYPILLLTCWTGLVGVGTYALLQTTLRQHFALKFPSVHGLVVRSEVGQGAVSRRGVEIEYNYAVDGKNYTGHRFRYDDHNVALEWNAAVDEHPRWSFVTVYYNPANPGDSLLKPGVDGSDLLLLLFALPLNVVSFLLWSTLITRMRERSASRSAGGVRILKHLGETRVLLAETPALVLGVYAAAITAFVAAFPAVTTGGFEPRMIVMEIVWAVVLAAGLGTFFWRAMRNRSGAYDLRIDQSAHTVSLPQMAGRRKTLSISREAISGVTLQRRASIGPSGTHFSYLPALLHNGSQAAAQSIKLITWGWSEEKAQAFSRWLSQELGVEFVGVEDESTALAVKH